MTDPSSHPGPDDLLLAQLMRDLDETAQSRSAER
jgi:hypothetical protein